MTHVVSVFTLLIISLWAGYSLCSIHLESSEDDHPNDDSLVIIGERAEAENDAQSDIRVKHKSKGKGKGKDKLKRRPKPAKRSKKLSQNTINIIKKECRARSGRKCKTPKEKTGPRRNKNRSLTEKALKRTHRFRDNQQEAEDEAEVICRNILALKTQQLTEAGVADLVEADDDCILENDILNIPGFTDSSRNKRSIFDYGQSAVFKRPKMPIKWGFASGLTSSEKQLARQGATAITTKVPCITLKEVASQPPSGIYVEINKIDTPEQEGGTLCGSAFLGTLEDYNPININFNATKCGGQPVVVGNIIHEWLHILGVFHQQSRFDRDEFLIILIENVLQRFIGEIQRVNYGLGTTTVGVGYDYESVMHYSATTYAKAGNQSMIPKLEGVDPSVLGRKTELSCGDRQLLHKMFCCTSCADKNEDCSALAFLEDCINPTFNDWMVLNCPLTCNVCCG